MFALTVVVRPTRPSSVSTGISGCETVLFAAIDRNCSPPSGRITRDDLRRHETKERALAVVECVTEAVYLMFDIAQGFVGCF